MSTLPTIIALAALVGLTVVWLRLQTVKKKVEQLGRLHGSSEGGTAVEFKGLSLPPFTSPDETASGAEAANGLIVLGYRTNLVFDLTNQTSAHNAISRDMVIGTPAGTTQVVPLLTGSVQMFGKLTLNPNGTVASLSVEDHHLGLVAVGIYVASYGVGAVTLRATSLLMDKNGDDKWSGVVYGAALFLGSHP